MGPLVFSTAALLACGSLVLGGPFNIRREKRDTNQDAFSFYSDWPTTLPLVATLPTLSDTSTFGPGKPDSPVSSQGAPEIALLPIRFGDNKDAELAATSTSGAYVPDTPVPPAVSEDSTNQKDPANQNGFGEDTHAKLASALTLNTVTNSPDVFGVTPITSSQSSIGSSYETAFALPNSLAADLDQIASGAYRYCIWELNYERRNLVRNNNKCGAKWSDFVKAFDDSGPGFALYRKDANNRKDPKTVLSLMNVVHECGVLDANNNWTKAYQWMNWICRDLEILKTYEPEWVDAVKHTFANVISIDSVRNDQTLNGIYKQYLKG
ncbi:hypothetical protein MMC07_003391 [Pseudocyphellaria aurata]|nr:hypothetical protein [Pseudocyphellaria aurata]